MKINSSNVKNASNPQVLLSLNGDELSFTPDQAREVIAKMQAELDALKQPTDEFLKFRLDERRGEVITVSRRTAFGETWMVETNWSALGAQTDVNVVRHFAELLFQAAAEHERLEAEVREYLAATAAANPAKEAK